MCCNIPKGSQKLEVKNISQSHIFWCHNTNRQNECVHEWHLLRSRQRSALSTEQSLSWLKRSAAVKTLTKYTATEYRWKNTMADCEHLFLKKTNLIQKINPRSVNRRSLDYCVLLLAKVLQPQFHNNIFGFLNHVAKHKRKNLPLQNTSELLDLFFSWRSSNVLTVRNTCVLQCFIFWHHTKVRLTLPKFPQVMVTLLLALERCSQGVMLIGRQGRRGSTPGLFEG